MSLAMKESQPNWFCPHFLEKEYHQDRPLSVVQSNKINFLVCVQDNANTSLSDPVPIVPHLHLPNNHLEALRSLKVVESENLGIVPSPFGTRISHLDASELPHPSTSSVQSLQ